MTDRETVPSDADRRYDDAAVRSARAVVDTYSTSFGWACRLLGPAVRDDVRSVYALVRVADEIVDRPRAEVGARSAREALDALEADVAAAIDGARSTNLVVHAFATTATRADIGSELTGPFFDSMRRDLDPSPHDPDSLARYVHGSAEVVGLMCLRLFALAPDARPGATERLDDGAARLGRAFQMVNFLRDLAHDRDELDRDYLGTGTAAHPLTTSTRDAILDGIDADLRAGAAAARRLPPSSRLAVVVAHDLFAELSARLREAPVETLARTRVRVPDARKAAIVAKVMLTGGRAGSSRP